MMGLRELAILAVVVLVLYGRSGVLKSRQFQTIWPWISPQRRIEPTAQPAVTSRRSAARFAGRTDLAAAPPCGLTPATRGSRNGQMFFVLLPRRTVLVSGSLTIPGCDRRRPPVIDRSHEC